MKSSRKSAVLGWALVLLSSAAMAQSTGGGCLQGTWHYFDANGRLVGEQTVGCAELDGAWGAVTSNKTFTQGCAASF
jgi:Family of unknown function (DUF6289)